MFGKLILKLISKKKLFKLLCPEPAVLAEIAANAAANFVNNSGKDQVIQEWVEKTESLRQAQATVTRWLADGKFEESEVEELKRAITPLFETVYSKVEEGLS